MQRLWLVRHGETESNRDGIFQGHLDAALNERGIEQATRMADCLAGVRFDRIFSSDLSRAGRTAELIATRQNAIVEYDRDLREMHYGVLQGVRYDTAASVLAEQGLADAWHDGRFASRGMAAPGGESARMVRHRAKRFLGRIADNCGSDAPTNLLIVAHGGQLRIMLTVLLALPLAHRNAFAFANCGLSRVSRYDGRSVLDLHNAVLWEQAGHAPRLR